MKNEESNRAFWAIMIVAAALHFSFCDWIRDYRPFNPRAIAGLPQIIGLHATSTNTLQRDILFGLAFPAGLIIAAATLEKD